MTQCPPQYKLMGRHGINNMTLIRVDDMSSCECIKVVTDILAKLSSGWLWKYRSKASFWYMFHVYTLINYMVIKLIKCRYDFLAPAAVTCMIARKSYLRRYDFLAFHGKSDTPPKWLNIFFVGLFEEFQQYLYCLWISTCSDCKVYFFFKTINIPKFESKVKF